MACCETWPHSTGLDDDIRLDGFTACRPISAEESGKTRVSGLGTCINNRWCSKVNIKTTVCTTNLELLTLSVRPVYLHAVFRMCMSYYNSYWHSHQSCISLHVTAGICTVPTADAVATCQVSCFNCIVRLCSISRFAETIRQGYCSAALRPLAGVAGLNLTALLQGRRSGFKSGGGTEDQFIYTSMYA